MIMAGSLTIRNSKTFVSSSISSTIALPSCTPNLIGRWRSPIGWFSKASRLVWCKLRAHRLTTSTTSLQSTSNQFSGIDLRRFTHLVSASPLSLTCSRPRMSRGLLTRRTCPLMATRDSSMCPVHCCVLFRVTKMHCFPQLHRRRGMCWRSRYGEEHQNWHARKIRGLMDDPVNIRNMCVSLVLHL